MVKDREAQCGHFRRRNTPGTADSIWQPCALVVPWLLGCVSGRTLKRRGRPCRVCRPELKQGPTAPTQQILFPSSGDYLGGEAYWAGGLHLYTPLPFRPGQGGFGELFRTHFFLNAGNLCNLNYGESAPAQS